VRPCRFVQHGSRCKARRLTGGIEDVPAALGRNVQCQPVRGVHTREECHWSHACKSFNSEHACEHLLRGNHWHPRVQILVEKRAPYPPSEHCRFDSASALDHSVTNVVNVSATVSPKHSAASTNKLCPLYSTQVNVPAPSWHSVSTSFINCACTVQEVVSGADR
jgi:hypothetical protein